MSILRSDPTTAMVEYQEKLPLHVAAESGCETFVIEELISLFPDSIAARDGTSLLYPFQLAATSESAA